MNQRGEMTTAVQIIPGNAAFATFNTWAKQKNGEPAGDITMLKWKQEQVLKVSFKMKKKNKLKPYFKFSV